MMLTWRPSGGSGSRWGGRRRGHDLAGQVAERAEEVARPALLYDILKAEALSPRAPADLARKAIEKWT